MDAQKVDMFIVTNGKFFRPEIVPQIREKLLSLDESKWVMLQTIQFKDPTTSLIISLLGWIRYRPFLHRRCGNGCW